MTGDDPMAGTGWTAPPGAGSVTVPIATDAPLLPGQRTAPARRVPVGLARTGAIGHHSSGGLFLGFSTANAGALTGGFPSGSRGRDAAVRAVEPGGPVLRGGRGGRAERAAGRRDYGRPRRAPPGPRATG
ncbi:P1 family peptidase [Actinomadura kijaniata]|uniref:P1 family peptidase n=1 Tax=Actinomadura kijaniata TaxID=46161 RepID=UPI003F1DEF14